MGATNVIRWFLVGLSLSSVWLAPGTPAHALGPEDQAVVREAFQAARRNEWPRVLRLVALVQDPLPGKTLRWLRMVQTGRPADFATVATDRRLVVFDAESGDWRSRQLGVRD